MFFSQRAAREVAAFPGAVRRQVAVGASSQLMSFHLKKGAVVPPHSHPHEQLGMVMKW
jgi:quercetin dioxygenase-like cupin family protein